MKKTGRDICSTLVKACFICFVFWRIGWITSAKELCIWFVIAVAAVISVDHYEKWIEKKLKMDQ